ncbi:hypothetical protein RCL1_001201 [Eukaryota sp. TZLM3-RCL]
MQYSNTLIRLVIRSSLSSLKHSVVPPLLRSFRYLTVSLRCRIITLEELSFFFQHNSVCLSTELLHICSFLINVSVTKLCSSSILSLQDHSQRFPDLQHLSLLLSKHDAHRLNDLFLRNNFSSLNSLVFNSLFSMDSVVNLHNLLSLKLIEVSFPQGLHVFPSNLVTLKDLEFSLSQESEGEFVFDVSKLTRLTSLSVTAPFPHEYLQPIVCKLDGLVNLTSIKYLVIENVECSSCLNHEVRLLNFTLRNQSNLDSLTPFFEHEQVFNNCWFEFENIDVNVFVPLFPNLLSRVKSVRFDAYDSEHDIKLTLPNVEHITLRDASLVTLEVTPHLLHSLQLLDTSNNSVVCSNKLLFVSRLHCATWIHFELTQLLLRCPFLFTLVIDFGHRFTACYLKEVPCDYFNYLSEIDLSKPPKSFLSLFEFARLRSLILSVCTLNWAQTLVNFPRLTRVKLISVTVKGLMSSSVVTHLQLHDCVVQSFNFSSLVCLSSLDVIFHSKILLSPGFIDIPPSLLDFKLKSRVALFMRINSLPRYFNGQIIRGGDQEQVLIDRVIDKLPDEYPGTCLSLTVLEDGVERW